MTFVHNHKVSQHKPRQDSKRAVCLRRSLQNPVFIQAKIRNLHFPPALANEQEVIDSL